MKNKMIVCGLALYLLTSLCGCVIVPAHPYYVQSPAFVRVVYWH